MTDVADARLPPQNIDAEENVLGAMLISNRAIEDALDILDAGDFYRETHGVIYRACLRLYNQGEPVDAITVADQLEKNGQLADVGGPDKIRDLAGVVPAASNAAHWARIVHDLAALRGLIRVGHNIARLGYERPGETPDLIEQAEQEIFELAHKRETGDLRHVSHSLTDTHALMLRSQDTAVTGTPTGLTQLDQATAGLQPGNLIVLAARPSMGKSALAITIAHHVAAAAGKPVALFSLEMSESEVNQRLLAIETGLPLRKFRQASLLQPGDWPTVNNGFARIEKTPIYIDDSGDLRVGELRSRARRLKSKHPDLALIIVDYLQLMVGEARPENRVQEVSQISRGLKILARDLNIPVLALSQLSRAVETRPDRRPILSDLRDSGSIEQDADLVIFVYRAAVYQKDPSDEERSQAELIIAKHRNGATGSVDVHWEPRQATFKDKAVA